MDDTIISIISPVLSLTFRPTRFKTLNVPPQCFTMPIDGFIIFSHSAGFAQTPQGGDGPSPPAWHTAEGSATYLALAHASLDLALSPPLLTAVTT